MDLSLGTHVDDLRETEPLASTVEIRDRDLPELFRVADANSLKGQRRYLVAVRVRLLALLIGAAFGVLSWTVRGTDYAGVVAALAFGGAIIGELYLLRERPDRLWYAGRAVAESAKTLAWRFMVAGSPMGREEATDNDARNLLLERFTELTRDVQGMWLVPDSGDLDQITGTMGRVRQLPLEQRRDIYHHRRLLDQRDWYARKAQSNDQRATRWAYFLTAGEFAGVLFGVLKAAGLVEIDLLGLSAALVAAGAAWIQLKQYQNLSSAYAIACHELSAIASRVTRPDDEAEWAAFVGSAEDAISREHTMWRAAHNRTAAA